MRGRDVVRGAGLLLLLARAASADAPTSTVTITLNAEGQNLAQGLGETQAELIQRVHDKIDSLYQLANIADLLHAFGDASVAANRGFGVDYAIFDGAIEVGFVATAAFAGGPPVGTKGATAGDVIAYGGTAGASLARWGVPRISVFANVGYTSASIDELSGHLTTFGAHARVDAIRPRGAWLGLALTSGLEISRASLGATHGGLTSKFTVQGNTPGESRNLTFSAAGTLDLVATTETVPLIVTTGVRAGGFSAYVGGGLDLTTGGSTMTASLDGDLSITQDMTKVGTLQITASGTQDATATALRALAGMSVQAWHVNVFLQGDISQTASGVTLGLRATL